MQWKLAADLLLPQQRREYLSCLLDAIAGVETARNLLACVRGHREQEEAAPAGARQRGC